MTGPRPAVRTADEAAAIAWDNLLDAYRAEGVRRLTAPHESAAANEAVIERNVAILHALTGEDPDAIRQRAVYASIRRPAEESLF